MNENVQALSKFIDKKFAERKEEFAKKVIDNAKLIIDGHLGGKPSDMTESLSYEIEGDEITILTSDNRVVFFDRGTQPHIIRPKKPGGTLAFRAQQSFTYKDGSKGQFGDLVFAKEVRHPGMEPRPIIQPALFITSKHFK